MVRILADLREVCRQCGIRNSVVFQREVNPIRVYPLHQCSSAS